MPKKAVGSTASIIGQKIKKVRMDKNITLDNIANETGFSIDHLKKIESGKIPLLSAPCFRFPER
jgi:cytoskeletal protein RodZ